MYKVFEVLAKPASRKIMKGIGVSLIGTSSVLSAMKADETTQKVVITLASKVASKVLKK